MNSLIRCLLLWIFLFAAVGLQAQQQEGYYIRFDIKDPRQLDTLTRMISIDDVRDHTVYAYATASQLEGLRQETSFSITLLSVPGGKRRSFSMASSPGEMAQWDQYPTYGCYAAMMDSMAGAHPGISRLDTIGSTVEGRHLVVMRITDHPHREEPEPEVFYTSTMHGNEAGGYVMMLRLIDTLLSSYGQSEHITRLINHLDLFINPNANPDGTYAGGDHTVAGAVRYNARGVDLNRNFPGPVAGEHPDGHSWQPETRAMMDFAANQTINLSVNFHGGAEVVNYPWDTWSRSHVDAAWFQDISRVYARSVQENSPEGYFAGLSDSGIINGYDWYTIKGGRQDYMTYFKGAREVTIELTNTKMPGSPLLRNLWRYNREALLLYMEQALDGIHGRVTGGGEDPLKARLHLSNHDTCLDRSWITTDPEIGDYHRLIDSGSYDLKFSAFGHRDSTVTDLRLAPDQPLQLDVNLKPLSNIPLDIQPDSLTGHMAIEARDTLPLIVANRDDLPAELNLRVQDSAQHPWIKPAALSQTISPAKSDTLNYFISSGNVDTTLSASIILSLPNMNSEMIVPVKVKVDQLQGLNDPVPNIQARCYPNPFYQVLNLELNLSAPSRKVSVQIHDSQGKLVKSTEKQSLPAGKHHISFHFHSGELSQGLYFIRIITPSGQLHRKVLHLHPVSD